MSNIVVHYDKHITDGTELVFRSPVDCSQITGLKVRALGEDGILAHYEFALADAHGNNVGDIDHLFAEGVVVKVILDTDTGMAFVQNADTNSYIEGELEKLRQAGGGVDPEELKSTVTGVIIEDFNSGGEIATAIESKLVEILTGGGDVVEVMSEIAVASVDPMLLDLGVYGNTEGESIPHAFDTNNPHQVTCEQIGAVKSVNGVAPDENGNVAVSSGSVDPDELHGMVAGIIAEDLENGGEIFGATHTLVSVTVENLLFDYQVCYQNDEGEYITHASDCNNPHQVTYKQVMETATTEDLEELVGLIDNRIATALGVIENGTY